MKKPATKTKRKPRTRSVKTQPMSQNVNVYVTKPTTTRTIKVKEVVKEPVRQLLPMMPSFNINQPVPQSQSQSQSSDLAKILGFLIPKKETESTLGESIKTPIQKPAEEVDKSPVFAGLSENKKESSIAEAVNNKIQSEAPLYEKPVFSNPYYGETEAEAVPLIQAEARVKRKYTRRKPKEAPIEQP